MTEQKKNAVKEEKQEQKKLPDQTKKMGASDNKKTSGSWLGYVSTIFLLIAIIVVAFVTQNHITALEKKVGQDALNNSDLVKSLDARISSAVSRFSEINKKLDELEARQDVLEHNLSEPVQQQIIVNEDYALAEIEHLLIIANYKLQLEQNVMSALAAMEAADKRLMGLRDPAVLSVREQLIADMNELRTLNQSDLSGLGLFLSDLINRVDILPLKENVVVEPVELKTEKEEKQAEGIKEFFILVWQELKSLVIITRDSEVSKARLLPDEVYFLRANLKLELANARFAVFNRDTDNLHASIGHIKNWLNGYFDQTDAAVKNIYDALAKMQKLELAFPKLDISSSLESVRALMRQTDEQRIAPLP